MNAGSWCSCCSLTYNHSGSMLNNSHGRITTTNNDHSLFYDSSGNQIESVTEVFPYQNQINCSQKLYIQQTNQYNAYSQNLNPYNINSDRWFSPTAFGCCVSPIRYYESYIPYNMTLSANERSLVTSAYIPATPNHSYSELPSYQAASSSCKQLNHHSISDGYRLLFDNIKLETAHDNFLTGTNTPSCNHSGRRRNIRRSGIMQIQCPICSKKFSRPYNLKSHIKIHTKERPYVCRYGDCKWTFARPHDLKRHQLLHFGIKPHECICGKRFSRSDAYKRHLKSNSGCSTLTALTSISISNASY